MSIFVLAVANERAEGEVFLVQFEAAQTARTVSVADENCLE
jgi:hypothetical protein